MFIIVKCSKCVTLSFSNLYSSDINCFAFVTNWIEFTNGNTWLLFYYQKWTPGLIQIRLVTPIHNHALIYKAALVLLIKIVIELIFAVIVDPAVVLFGIVQNIRVPTTNMWLSIIRIWKTKKCGVNGVIYEGYFLIVGGFERPSRRNYAFFQMVESRFFWKLCHWSQVNFEPFLSFRFYQIGYFQFLVCSNRSNRHLELVKVCNGSLLDHHPNIWNGCLFPLLHVLLQLLKWFSKLNFVHWNFESRLIKHTLFWNWSFQKLRLLLICRNSCWFDRLSS